MRGAPLKRKKEFTAQANEFLATRRTFNVHDVFKAVPGYEATMFLRLFNVWVRGLQRKKIVECKSPPLASTKTYRKV